MSLKRTPLYPMHLKHNGKIIDFGGWELPVQYEGMGIIKEHNMVREKAGLFDVSHMGEITIIGEQAEQMVQKLVTNDVKSMQDFQVMYSPMCYPSGGVVDDLLVYRYDSKNYLLVVNAANTDKDYEWIQQNLIPGVEASNRSSEYAQLALQGPAAFFPWKGFAPSSEINHWPFFPAPRLFSAALIKFPRLACDKPHPLRFPPCLFLWPAGFLMPE
jgi:aminomethyltransferase